MNTFILLAVAIIGVAQAVDLAMEPRTEEWEEFKSKHDKKYENDVEEKFRSMIFTVNLQQIEKHNKGMHTHKLGINKFSDMLPSEFAAMMYGYRRSDRNLTARVPMAPSSLELRKHLPGHVDWRDKGAVTEVKNQGHCGSCWTFSATGALEGQNFLKTGKLIPLSEQNLIDCARGDRYSSYGCFGGDEDEAFQYVKDNGGIDTEESYPYEGKNNVCRYKESKKGAADSGFVKLPEGDEKALKRAVATYGPISVAIHATNDMKHYHSGVFLDDDCSSSPEKANHAVLVVGYGTDNGNDYWLVKNSWGADHGEQGYWRMARNRNNMCGIANDASYPIVN